MNYQKKNKEIAITIDETPKSFTVNENQKKNKQIAITIDENPKSVSVNENFVQSPMQSRKRNYILANRYQSTFHSDASSSNQLPTISDHDIDGRSYSSKRRRRKQSNAAQTFTGESSPQGPLCIYVICLFLIHLDMINFY